MSEEVRSDIQARAERAYIRARAERDRARGQREYQRLAAFCRKAGATLLILADVFTPGVVWDLSGHDLSAVTPAAWFAVAGLVCVNIWMFPDLFKLIGLIVGVVIAVIVGVIVLNNLMETIPAWGWLIVGACVAVVAILQKLDAIRDAIAESNALKRRRDDD
jgi:hypothetical protein